MGAYILMLVVTGWISAHTLAISRVPTGSMETAIIPGDYVLANRIAYRHKEPERGDIVLFHKGGLFLCKRVVALEGDVVSFRDGWLYLNGEKVQERYLKDEENETNSPKTFQVPEGCCFVLGDNREKSLDSRFWKKPFVPCNKLTAKVMLVVPVHIIFSLWEGDGTYPDNQKTLTIGEYGDYMAMDEVGGLEQCRVAMDHLYTGRKAIRFLKDHVPENGKVFEDAPEGTSWHVVRYSLSDSPKRIYTNICLRGIDGLPLEYNGKRYSKRTWDLFAGMKSGGEGYGNLYCYYAVPDGCQEYILEVGERDENGGPMACYLVKVSEYDTEGGKRSL